MPSRPSLTKKISSRFLGQAEKDNEDDDPAFFADEIVGPAIAQVIQSNLDRIPDESLIKITRQLEFWQSQGDLSTDELIELTKRLVHAASWRSRMDDENAFRVPKRRFGRTELQMPIITCGGMRIQHTWIPDNIPLLAPSKKKVLAGDSQKNLKDVVECCIKLGLNHFETARLYGTSELQFIDALVSLMKDGTVRREDFIFQTKVFPAKNREEFEKIFNYTWEHVSKLEYIDLFSFHAVSKESDVEWMMDDSKDGCYSFIKEYQAEGKIKHIGFSTHGTAETIMKMIESNKFDYVNIHCHYFGSYHGEGTPDTKGGHGNLACVKKALELDMGVFQISPFDKGGKLYKPSTAVAKAIGPDLTPISFAALHSWKTLGFHTVSVGFARVSDLDEVLEAACLYGNEKAMVALQQAETNLKNMAVEKLGQEWHDKGLLNIPSCYKESTTGVAIGHILWLHNVCTAFGMYEFARNRYSNLECAAWNDKKTFAENLDKMNSGNSGRAYQPDVDLTEALKDHHDSELVKLKLAEAHEWLTQSEDVLTDEERRTKGWDEAYSLTVWEDFPGDPTRSGFRGSVILQGLTGGYFGVNNKGDRRQSLEEAKSLRSSFRSSFTSISSEGDNSSIDPH